MQHQRNAAMDAARGFTVLIMPAVHSTLLHANRSVREGKLGKLLGLLAEGPGAQLFLLLMGASVAFGKKKKNCEIAGRFFKLLLSGYILNAVRLLPMYLNKLPQAFFRDHQVQDNPKGRMQLLLSGDILHCAAIAYPVCSLLYRNKHYYIQSFFFGLLTCLLSPLIWRIQTKNKAVQLLLNLLSGEPPQAFFPVFPWMAYALIGLGLGHFLKNGSSRKFYLTLFLTGCCLLFAGKKISELESDHRNENFYRPGPGGTLYHTGIVFIWLCFCYQSTGMLKRTRFFDLLQFLSKHITVVYFIQWILVFWSIPFWGYRKLNMKRTLLSIAFTTSATFMLTYLYSKLSGSTQHRKNLLHKTAIL